MVTVLLVMWIMVVIIMLLLLIMMMMQRRRSIQPLSMFCEVGVLSGSPLRAKACIHLVSVYKWPRVLASWLHLS